MRVALVSWHTSPTAAAGAGAAGGMNVYVRELARALASRGLEVDVLTRGPRLAARRLGPRLRLVSLAGPDRLGELPRYRVVHSHYWQSAPVARALAERDRARHVHTFHTLGEVKNAALAPGETPEPDARLALERELVADADAVVVSTRAEAARVAGLGGTPGRLRVAAPGVDHRRFLWEAPADGRLVRLGLDAGAAVILHVGRIQPLKGLDLAVGALARLDRPILLALAGGPSGRSGPGALTAVRRAAQWLPPGSGVAWLGRQDQRALPGLLAAADVALVASRTESFGLAALEAAACGVPVVGTRVGGLLDVVVDGVSGRLVDTSAAGLAGGLEATLAARASRRRRIGMSRAAVESARRYSWAATAAAVCEVYA